MTDLSWLTARPVAHRGYHDLNKTVWENTLSAFDRAMERGFAIECDVHLTSDGVPVVLHDTELMRLTNTDGFVWQRTAAEMASLRIGGTADHPPLLTELLNLVDGRVPLVVELKGTPGHDQGLVASVGQILRGYGGKVAIMSFDHWLIRNFAKDAPGIPAGLTAYGTKLQDIEAHFSMLAHGVSFVSYSAPELPNRFTSFVREKLAMPVITWTVRDQAGVEQTRLHGDQMTFEGFDPDAVPVA
jgi:glycerophosphoryl diester phosphodiesterase